MFVRSRQRAIAPQFSEKMTQRGNQPLKQTLRPQRGGCPLEDIFQHQPIQCLDRNQALVEKWRAGFTWPSKTTVADCNRLVYQLAQPGLRKLRHLTDIVACLSYLTQQVEPLDLRLRV